MDNEDNNRMIDREECGKVYRSQKLEASDRSHIQPPPPSLII